MKIPEKLKQFSTSNWGILGGITLVVLLVLSPVLLLHRSTFFVNLDNVDQFYTWYQKLAVSWHHGYLPIWNANVYGGSSFAGELQQGVFYPINWLWVALFGSAKGISELALNYLVALHFVIAGFGCYLWLKEIGVKKWSAFAACIIFAFSGAVAVRAASQTVIFFALAYVPYPLYFYSRYRLHRQSFRNVIMAGASLGFILLVGHIQPFFHAAVALGIFEVVLLINRIKTLKQLKQQALPTVKNFAVIGASALVVALPQLWVSASYLPNAYRVQARGYVAPGEKIDYEEFSKSFNLDPHEFASLVDPGSYPIRDGNSPFIGLASLAVIIAALVLAREKMKRHKAWQQQGAYVASLLTFSFIAMLGYVTWFAVVLYKLPLVYQIRQLGRYVVLFDLALAAIVAISLEALSTIKLRKQQRNWLLVLGGFFVVQFVYLALLRHMIFGTYLALQYGVLASFLLLYALLKSYRSQLLVAIMIGVVVANAAWFLPKIKADTETPKVYTEQPTGLITALEQTSGQYRIGWQENALPINSGNVFNFQTTAGYSATIDAPFYRFAHTSNLDPNFINDILGVRLYVKRTLVAGDKVVYQDKKHNLAIVDRPSALPKFFVTTQQGSTNRADYRGLPVKTTHYSDLEQSFVVENSKTQQVIASELYYPGWTATIDGKRVQLEDYAIGQYPLLKAVQLPAGKHTVSFHYKAFKFF